MNNPNEQATAAESTNGEQTVVSATTDIETASVPDQPVTISDTGIVTAAVSEEAEGDGSLLNLVDWALVQGGWRVTHTSDTNSTVEDNSAEPHLMPMLSLEQLCTHHSTFRPSLLSIQPQVEVVVRHIEKKLNIRLTEHIRHLSASLKAGESQEGNADLAPLRVLELNSHPISLSKRVRKLLPKELRKYVKFSYLLPSPSDVTACAAHFKLSQKEDETTADFNNRVGTAWSALASQIHSATCGHPWIESSDSFDLVISPANSGLEATKIFYYPLFENAELIHFSSVPLANTTAVPNVERYRDDVDRALATLNSSFSHEEANLVEPPFAPIDNLNIRFQGKVSAAYQHASNLFSLHYEGCSVAAYNQKGKVVERIKIEPFNFYQPYRVPQDQRFLAKTFEVAYHPTDAGAEVLIGPEVPSVQMTPACQPTAMFPDAYTTMKVSIFRAGTVGSLDGEAASLAAMHSDVSMPIALSDYEAPIDDTTVDELPVRKKIARKDLAEEE